MQSVRFPWAMVVPNGLSVFARSVSTWIHWWSPETSANLSMSSWVTSRQSLGPICCPTSALSSSIPFTVVGVLMSGSLSVVVPGLRLQGFAERLRAAAHDRCSVRDQHVVRAQLQQRPHARREALSVKSRHLRVDFFGRPHDQPPLGLGDGITEYERGVAREVERRLVAARLAYRVSGYAAGKLFVRVDRAEAGLGLQALRARRMTVNGGVRLLAVATPQLLGAAHVVRDRDEDGEATAQRSVDRIEDPCGVGFVPGQQRIDQQSGVAGLRCEAGHLGAELARVPLGVP